VPSPPRPEILDLEPGASAFLDLLVELGHLDDAMLLLVNDRLLDLRPDPAREPSGAVSLADLKRIAAEVIQDHLDETDLDYQRAVDREWPLLFY